MTFPVILTLVWEITTTVEILMEDHGRGATILKEGLLDGNYVTFPTVTRLQQVQRVKREQ